MEIFLFQMIDYHIIKNYMYIVYKSSNYTIKRCIYDMLKIINFCKLYNYSLKSISLKWWITLQPVQLTPTNFYDIQIATYDRQFKIKQFAYIYLSEQDHIERLRDRTGPYTDILTTLKNKNSLELMRIIESKYT